MIRRRGTFNGQRGPCCTCGNLIGTCISFDMFAKRPELRLPNGKTKYNTLQGCMCSLMMLGVIVLFVLSSVRNMFLDSEFPDEDPRLDILMMNSIERDYYNG